MPLAQTLAGIPNPGEAMADRFQGFWWPVVQALAVLAVLAGLAFVAMRWMYRRRSPARVGQAETGIAVHTLPELGPPAEGPRLLYRNIPVRLAAVVLAPPGRARELPPINRLGEVFEALVPGLTEVIRRHRPVYRRWPPQVSTRGFVHRFFAEAGMAAPPGTATPWCLVAGPLAFQQQPLLVGLLMRAASPTHLGPYIVEEPSDWPRLISVDMRDAHGGS